LIKYEFFNVGFYEECEENKSSRKKTDKIDEKVEEKNQLQTQPALYMAEIRDKLQMNSPKLIQMFVLEK